MSKQPGRSSSAAGAGPMKDVAVERRDPVKRAGGVHDEDQTAAQLAAPDSDHPDELLVEEIACLAFAYWNEAGSPPGRLQEFWRKAEQQVEILFEEIASVAFEGWNQAGRPPGRLEQFWRKAEGQIPAIQKAPAGANHSSRRLERKPARRRLRNFLRTKLS